MRLNGWQRIGVLLSVVWLLASSWAYFYEINNHPSGLASYIPDAGYYWTKDFAATQKAQDHAKQRGKDFYDRFVFLKPTFDPYGFLGVTLTPLVVCWVNIYLIFWIVRWVKRGFDNKLSGRR